MHSAYVDKNFHSRQCETKRTNVVTPNRLGTHLNFDPGVSGFVCLNKPVSGDVSGDDTRAVMAEVVLFMPIVLLASVLEVVWGHGRHVFFLSSVYPSIWSLNLFSLILAITEVKGVNMRSNAKNRKTKRKPGWTQLKKGEEMGEGWHTCFIAGCTRGGKKPNSRTHHVWDVFFYT